MNVYIYRKKLIQNINFCNNCSKKKFIQKLFNSMRTEAVLSTIEQRIKFHLLSEIQLCYMTLHLQISEYQTGQRSEVHCIT